MMFDIWKSYIDFFCQYVKDIYVGLDRDMFFFDISLFEKIQFYERMEFVVYYECNGQMYWDSNRGKNYRIIWVELKFIQGMIKFYNGLDLGIFFD